MSMSSSFFLFSRREFHNQEEHVSFVNFSERMNALEGFVDGGEPPEDAGLERWSVDEFTEDVLHVLVLLIRTGFEWADCYQKI